MTPAEKLNKAFVEMSMEIGSQIFGEEAKLMDEAISEVEEMEEMVASEDNDQLLGARIRKFIKDRKEEVKNLDKPSRENQWDGFNFDDD